MKPIVVLFTLLLLSACNSRVEKNPGSPVATTKWARIQQTILTPKCVSCHAGPGASASIDVSSFQALTQSRAVVAFKPEESRLYQSLVMADTAKRMPKGRDPLKREDIDLVYSWIRDGAGEKDGQSLPPPAPTATFQSLYSTIFEPRCVVCHNTEKARGKVDLSSYAKLAASQGNKLKPFVARDPEHSGIFVEVSEQKMPPEPRKLSEQETVALHDWINNGAREVTPGAVIPPMPPAPPGPPQPTYEWLSRIVFSRRCGSCHGIPFKVADVDFTSYATLMASAGQNLSPVTAGNPEKSAIYQEVVAGHMPPPRKGLTAEEIALVRQWIQAGALNE